MYAYPARVIKINKQTMQQTQTLELFHGENDVRWLISAGQSLNLQHEPFRFISLSASGGTVDSSTPKFLYAFTNTAPGKIVKIQADTLKR